MGMKEKKVDFLLAIASFCQLCVIGISSSVYTEFVKPEGDERLLLILGAGDMAAILMLVVFWIRARKRIKK